MPAIDFRAARAQVHLAEVLELLRFLPRTRHGDQVRGRCPVHDSRSPTSRSFAAHLGKHVILGQAFRHPSVAASRLPSPAPRPEKVLTVSSRPECCIRI